MMNRDMQDAVDVLAEYNTTAESHTIEVQTSAYIAELEQAQPRTEPVQEAIAAIEQLETEGNRVTRGRLTELLRGRSSPAQLALIFAWGAGDWPLWRHNTRECLQRQSARCAGFDSNVEAIKFLLDPAATFTVVGRPERSSGAVLDPYEAFVKLWCPPTFRQALVPYAATAFGTKLLYFAARLGEVDEPRPLIYDKRVADSLRALNVTWTGGGKTDQPFPLPTQVMPFACYDAYCRWCVEVASVLGRDGVTLDGRPPVADDIECWLWTLAGDVTDPAPVPTDDPTVDAGPAGSDDQETEQPDHQPPAAAPTVRDAAAEVLAFASAARSVAVGVR